MKFVHFGGKKLPPNAICMGNGQKLTSLVRNSGKQQANDSNFIQCVLGENQGNPATLIN